MRKLSHIFCISGYRNRRDAFNTAASMPTPGHPPAGAEIASGGLRPAVMCSTGQGIYGNHRIDELCMAPGIAPYIGGTRRKMPLPGKAGLGFFKSYL